MGNEMKIEPQHRMYLNSFNTSLSFTTNIIEPQHRMYLNVANAVTEKGVSD